MGQESSTPIDESVPPQTLQGRTLEGLAKYIKDGRAKRIVVMVCLPCLALPFPPLAFTRLLT